MNPLSKHHNMEKQQLLKRIQVLAPFIDAIADDENLLELGLDSIHIMQLVNDYRASGHSVTFSQLIEAPTISDWLRLLR